jgi:hypothetical protein
MPFFKVVFLACVVSVAMLSGVAQTISAAERAHHIGERRTVCGEIAGEHTATNSHGTPTFINLDKPYPHQVFTVLIWGEDKEQVGQLPTSGKICATGTISQYKGSPEIVLRDSHSWYVPK